MQEFAKIFKNLVVLLENGSVKEVIKVGHSVRVEEGTIHLYREEGRLSPDGSTSKGFRKKVNFKGTPTIEGIYGLMSLRVNGGRYPILRKTEVFISRDAFGVITERVSLYQISYHPLEGLLIKEDLVTHKEETITEVEKSKGLGRYLETLPRIWNLLDHLDH